MGASGSEFFSDHVEEAVLSPGERFRGYEVKKLLGRGGAGMVYLVRHEMLDSLLALKLMSVPDTTAGDEPVKRFIREAKIASRIQHPNLVRVHDAGFDSMRNCYFLVMDYMPGGTLRDRIGLDGPIPEAEAVEIVRQIASALAAGARFGVVHRDIKPENIMFTSDGRAKLVDLGIAKVCLDDTLHTSTGATFGTPNYMAPEQALDASTVDTRADVYSLGIVLFEMLCGRTPFAGDTVQSIIAQVVSDSPIIDIKRIQPGVSNWVSALLFRMCAKQKEKRIASPEILVGEILKHTGQRPDPEESAEYAQIQPKSPVARPNTPEEDAAIDAEIEAKRRARRRREIIKKSIFWGVVGLLAAATILFIVL